MYTRHAFHGTNHTIQHSALPSAFVEESRAPAIIAGNAVCQLFSTATTIARIYSQAFVLKRWNIEEYILLAAWSCASCYTALQIAETTSGVGRHVATLSHSQVVQIQKYAYASLILQLAGLPLPKIGLCLFYLRIFDSDRRRKSWIYAITILLVLLLIASTVEIIFQCKPISAYWLQARPVDKCLSDISAFYVVGSVNVLCDIALIVIVFPRIIILKVLGRQKSILITITLLGWLVVGAGIFRMVRVGSDIHWGKGFDLSWNMYDVSIWSGLELHLSVICASAPGLKPLAGRFFPRAFGPTLTGSWKDWVEEAQPNEIFLKH